MRLDHLLSMETNHSNMINIQGQTEFWSSRCLIFEVQHGPGKNGGVAQLGEHLLCKQGVIGSIPFISTTFPKKGKRGTSEETSGKEDNMGS